jgi:hypothetical protein
VNQQTAYDVQHWSCCVRPASSWLFIPLFIIQDARSNEIKIKIYRTDYNINIVKIKTIYCALLVEIKTVSI